MFAIPCLSRTKTLQADYLVAGAGVQGLGFVDALLAHDTTCSVIIADLHGQPGGVWNEAPAFAHLSLPSSQYGVTSRRLSKCASEFASRDELLVYFNAVLIDFLGTGRVQYFAKVAVTNGGNRLVSVLDPELELEVEVRRKFVDATSAMHWAVPTSEPPFEVQDGALVVSPSSLPTMSFGCPMYVVIGGGRSGVDVVLWLLSCGVAAERLQWIRPREAWFRGLEAVLPDQRGNLTARMWTSLSTCVSAEAFIHEMEDAGVFYRIDTSREPEVFIPTYVSSNDVAQLRKVSNVIRSGHVRAISANHVVLEGGVFETPPRTLCVDCTGGRVRAQSKAVPVWNDRKITLQEIMQASSVAGFNASFSAAIVGMLEGRFPEKEKMKNALCTGFHFPGGQGTLQPSVQATPWREADLAAWWFQCELNPMSGTTVADIHRLKVSIGDNVIRAALSNLARMRQVHGDASQRPENAIPAARDEEGFSVHPQGEGLCGDCASTCASTAPDSSLGPSRTEFGAQPSFDFEALDLAEASCARVPRIAQILRIWPCWLPWHMET